jgi:hypothetical protein
MKTESFVLSTDQQAALIKLNEDYLRQHKLLLPGMQLHLTLAVVVAPLVSVSVESGTWDKILATKIGDGNLQGEFTSRVYNVLNNKGIVTVGQAVRISENDWWKFRNFGKKGMAEMKTFFANLGLTMGMKIEAGPLEKELMRTIPLTWFGFSPHCATMFADNGARDIVAIADLPYKKLAVVLGLLNHGDDEGNDCAPIYYGDLGARARYLIGHLAKFGLCPQTA